MLIRAFSAFFMTQDDIDKLTARRTAVIAELNALSTTTAGGLPNAIGGEGERIDHKGYKQGLYEELKSVNELLQLAEPWEVWS